MSIRLLSTLSAALIAVTAATPQASAQLVFDSTRLELNAAAADEVISGTFHFRNKGFADEEIIEVESTCGCLSATMDKQTYAPGEEGRLRAVFKLTNFVGIHEKLLIVRTANPKAPPIDLVVQINVPEIFRSSPEIHEWTLEGEADPRRFSVEILGDAPINITDVSATRTNVDFKLHTLEPGRRYEVEVTPHDTSRVTMGAIRLITDSDIPKFQRMMLFFSISPETKKSGGS